MTEFGKLVTQAKKRIKECIAPSDAALSKDARIAAAELVVLTEAFVLTSLSEIKGQSITETDIKEVFDILK